MTSITPIQPSAPTIGAAIMQVGMCPVDRAVSSEKAGLAARSSTIMHWPDCSTQPATPVPAGNRMPSRCCSWGCATASNTSSSVSSSRNRMDAL